MPDKNLYTLAVPRDAQTLARSQTRRNTATQGILDEDTAAVESLSLEAGQQMLRGQYRGEYSELMAEEFEELFQSSGIEQVPFFATNGRTKGDGYYTLANVDAEPLDPRSQRAHKFDGVLTNVGTRRTHYRSAATTVVQVENDYGNDQTAYVGVPAAATDLRWFNRETAATEQPTIVETRSAEYGDVVLVDALASSYDNPTLLYELPYDQEGKVDTVVWDDHGRSKLDRDYSGDRVGTVTVGDSRVGEERTVNAWQWVFSTGHEFVGAPRVENGLVRLEFDPASNTLRASEWNTTVEAWDATSLGASDWEFVSVDLTRIGCERVDAQCRFQDPSQSPTAVFTLDMSLKRGYRHPQWVVPENESGPVPSGLVDLLAPIADESDYSPQCGQGLVAREEVRK